MTAYVGYDCTADSLHIGHLISIMMLRWLQKTGHRPIVLMGGGTTKVGDPTDKDQQRPLLTDAVINANLASIRSGRSHKFLSFGDGPTDAIMVNNADWLEKLGYVEFLRDYGVHFTINRMLAFDCVKLRLEREQPLTFLEFNYMLMQATDFLELNRRHGCTLQMGGSDQWGNIINGVELIRRVDGKQAFGLTTPLLTTALGREDGQDRGRGGVAERRPAEPLRLLADVAQHRGRRRRPVPEAVHRAAAGRDRAAGGAAAAPRSTRPRRCWPTKPPPCCTAPRRRRRRPAAAKAAFEEGRLSDDLPTVEIPAGEMAAMSNTALMVAAGFASSNGDARRQIAGGAFRINGVKVADANAPASIEGSEAELRKGNARKRLVVTS